MLKYCSKINNNIDNNNNSELFAVLNRFMKCVFVCVCAWHEPPWEKKYLKKLADVATK